MSIQIRQTFQKQNYQRPSNYFNQQNKNFGIHQPNYAVEQLHNTENCEENFEQEEYNNIKLLTIVTIIIYPKQISKIMLDMKIMLNRRFRNPHLCVGLCRRHRFVRKSRQGHVHRPRSVRALHEG